MTAEFVEHRHQWPVPPKDGYTVDDLFTLPNLPSHTELIDGSLIFVSPQRYFHFFVIELLMKGLYRALLQNWKPCGKWPWYSTGKTSPSRTSAWFTLPRSVRWI